MFTTPAPKLPSLSTIRRLQELKTLKSQKLMQQIQKLVPLVNLLEREITDESRLFKVVSDFFMDFKNHLDVIFIAKGGERAIEHIEEDNKTLSEKNMKDIAKWRAYIEKKTNDVTESGAMGQACLFCKNHHVNAQSQLEFYRGFKEDFLKNLKELLRANRVLSSQEIDTELLKLSLPQGLDAETVTMNNIVTRIRQIQKELLFHINDVAHAAHAFESNRRVSALVFDTIYKYCTGDSSRIVAPIILDLWPTVRTELLKLAELDVNFMETNMKLFDSLFRREKELFTDLLLKSANRWLQRSQAPLLENLTLTSKISFLNAQIIYRPMNHSHRQFELHYLSQAALTAHLKKEDDKLPRRRTVSISDAVNTSSSSETSGGSSTKTKKKSQKSKKR